jgi:hypothetical protein
VNNEKLRKSQLNARTQERNKKLNYNTEILKLSPIISKRGSQLNSG